MRKQDPFYEKIIDAIIGEEYIEYNKVNNEYPSIHYVIANVINAGLEKWQRKGLLEITAIKVKNGLDPAIEIAKKRGLIIYKIVEEGKKHIHCVTIDPDYKDAREEAIRREKNKLEQRQNVFIKNIKLMDEKQLLQNVSDVVKLLEERIKKDN